MATIDSSRCYCNGFIASSVIKSQVRNRLDDGHGTTSPHFDLLAGRLLLSHLSFTKFFCSSHSGNHFNKTDIVEVKSSFAT